MTVIGLGHDIVHLPSFGEQLADAASGFEAGTFTEGERASVAAVGPRRVESLAGRFAAKEAFVKAWSVARFGRPPAASTVDLREIEVVADGWSRPAIALAGSVAASVADLAPDGHQLRVHLSLSHDGPVASAVVILDLTDTADQATNPI